MWKTGVSSLSGPSLRVSRGSGAKWPRLGYGARRPDARTRPPSISHSSKLTDTPGSERCADLTSVALERNREVRRMVCNSWMRLDQETTASAEKHQAVTEAFALATASLGRSRATRKAPGHDEESIEASHKRPCEVEALSTDHHLLSRWYIPLDPVTSLGLERPLPHSRAATGERVTACGQTLGLVDAWSSEARLAPPPRFGPMPGRSSHPPRIPLQRDSAPLQRLAPSSDSA